MAPHERYWWLGAAVSGLALLAVVWFQWGQHKLRNHRMKRPFHVSFTTETGSGAYYEMHWPKNSEVTLNLRMRPRINFTRHALVFGFHEEGAGAPVPIKAVNTFIKIGKRREQLPSETDGHAIDYTNNYHIKETVEYTVGNVYTAGFLVRTSSPGRYKIRLELITDGGQSDPVEELFLVVEDR
jgi:hypothetical protein